MCVYLQVLNLENSKIGNSHLFTQSGDQAPCWHGAPVGDHGPGAAQAGRASALLLGGGSVALKDS